MFTRWHEMTDSQFLFAVKLWRRITHHKRLKNCSQELKDFFTVACGLGSKCGPLLVQLPPSMPLDTVRLHAFLDDLKCMIGKNPRKVAVEFRNKQWLCESVYALLDDYDVALCLADMPSCPITIPNNASFIYIRRHGPGGRYHGCYSAGHIMNDAEMIRSWCDQGRDVYVYFNNDAEGHALDNARQLIEKINQ
jgi:uncharacterized protein YecE (DUF72 family)